MTTVNSTTQTDPSAALASSLTGSKSLGKQDFLNLLVAQLQNQDPLNPQDPTAFTAQLAQFSSLEQLTSVNDTLTKMSSANNLSDLNLIGKQVVASGGQFTLGSGNANIGYQLDGAASKVNVQILDSNGEVVANLNQQNMANGEHMLAWDGTGNSGQPLPAGDYRVAVKATDADGNAVNATSLVQGTVQGVDLDQSGNTLVTDAGTFNMDKVVSVRNP